MNVDNNKNPRPASSKSDRPTKRDPVHNDNNDNSDDDEEEQEEEQQEKIVEGGT